MSEPKQFKLPDVGEGLTEGEILRWYVQPGDTVKVNQTVVEIETAKAAVELPSPFAGVVTELHFPEGATVGVGTPIITIDTQPDPARKEAVEPGSTGGPAPGRPAPGEPAPGGRTPVLVGYGPRTTTAVRRPRRSDRQPGVGPVSVQVLAKPPVRKLAKDLGVDLTQVSASGPNGTVTRQDVEAFAATPPPAVPPAISAAIPPAIPAAAPAVGDASREHRIPVRGVRKMTAQAMVTSAFTAPHVTEFLTVDMTRTMRLVRRFKELPDFAGVRVSPLLIVAKALLVALRRHPEINASWDEAAQQIVVKDYVNLGVAAATPRGLVVPNIKGAESLTLAQLAHALNDLARMAREGRTPPADMAGGTITITNVGVFGMDTGTPILNPGEAAILVFGAVRELPWVHKGKVKPRQVTTLGLSFDHRMVDGELGSRFLSDVGRILRDPTTALAWS